MSVIFYPEPAESINLEVQPDTIIRCKRAISPSGSYAGAAECNYFGLYPQRTHSSQNALRLFAFVVQEPAPGCPTLPGHRLAEQKNCPSINSVKTCLLLTTILLSFSYHDYLSSSP